LPASITRDGFASIKDDTSSSHPPLLGVSSLIDANNNKRG
jgi:hypothetical protein